MVGADKTCDKGKERTEHEEPLARRNVSASLHCKLQTNKNISTVT